MRFPGVPSEATPLAVIDTSVILAGLTGRKDGADAWVLDAVGTGEIEPVVGPAGIREFYAKIGSPKIRDANVDAAFAVRFALDLMAMGRTHHPAGYAWPTMPDEKDWWVLDLAYDSAADHIVTNDGHFLDRAERLRVYGFDVLTPEQLRAVVSPTP